MFIHDNEFARVETISERGYTLSRYTSREAANTGAEPIETLHLNGGPSISSCLAALPAGYVEDDSGLPEIASPPASVTARQIRLWLVAHGMSLANVEAAIDTIPDPMQRDMVRVEWEYAPYVERSHPMLLPLAAALGLTSEQVDDAFREAATL